MKKKERDLGAEYRRFSSFSKIRNEKGGADKLAIAKSIHRHYGLNRQSSASKALDKYK